jgi:ParB family chromosome partitioning protein
MTPPAKDKPGRKKAPALGRGLAALLGDGEPLDQGLPSEPKPGEKVIQLPLERLEPNPYQPRRVYDSRALQALADSIREHGVIQPLVVRPVGSGYQLIAGERRLRASQTAGLSQVPVVVRNATDEQALLLALLENLQREDLNPLEEARAFQRLMEEFSLTQEDVALAVGKDRSTVANTLRLLKLPSQIQLDVATGDISAGHARALLPLESQPLMRQVRDRIIKEGLSVRAAERMVKKLLKPAGDQPAAPSEEETYLASLADKLRRSLGTKVAIKRSGRKGRILIDFASDRELERLLELLKAL